MNCKPRDLAYIIQSKHQETIGAVVEVLYLDGFATEMEGTPCWRIASCRPLRREDGAVTTDGCIEDFRLRPISGVPVHDEEHDEVIA